MLLKILAGLAVIIGGVAIFAAFQPSEYRVERSVVIATHPGVPFAHVNNLRKMNEWSPWMKIDPNAKTTFEGPEEGVGAMQSWAGNQEIGEGRQTIVDSRPNELVEFKLEFFKPFAGTAKTQFTFAPHGASETTVTWSMTGEKNYISKVISMFMSMDKMIGGNFEKGLAALKAVSEAEASKPENRRPSRPI